MLQPTWVRAALFWHFLALGFFRFEGDSTLPPQAANINRWAVPCITLIMLKGITKDILVSTI
jgi:hypothetical protein